MDERDLARRVQDLPGELYNIIYEYTFTVGPGERKISKTYQPPSLLTVDRASRKLFAKSYYGSSGSSFVHNRNGTKEVLIRWLRSLPRRHLRLLNEVKEVYYFTTSHDKLRKVNAVVLCRCQMGIKAEHWQNCFDSNGLGWIGNVFCLEIHYDQSKTKVDEEDERVFPKEEDVFITNV